MERTFMRRRKKLIKPGVQLRLVMSFVGLATLGLFLQFLFLGSRLTNSVATLEGPGGELARGIPRMLLEVFGLSIAILIPVMFVFGILLTFRIAGPIYRFEQFLKAVARGDQTGPCRIRKGDELQFLCDAINEATASLRQPRPMPTEDDSAEEGEDDSVRKAV